MNKNKAYKCPSCGAQELRDWHEKRESCMTGNNYDIVKYAIQQRCFRCGFSNHTTRSVRENVRGDYKDIDENDGQASTAPSRHGT